MIAFSVSLPLAALTGSVVQEWFDALGPLGRYLAALLIFFVGRFLAKAAGRIAGKSAARAGLDARLSKYVGTEGNSFSALVAKLFYYLLLLFVLIFALDFAGLNQVTQPLSNVFSKVFGFLPNLLGAGIIFFLGYVLAKVVRSIVQNVLAAAKLEQRIGMASGSNSLTNAIATVAFCLILLVITPAALAVLGIDEISAPILGIVNSITEAIPRILLAAALIAVGVFIARIVRNLVVNLLKGLGADTFPSRVGVSIPATGSRSVSEISGLVVFISIIVLISASAIDVLNIEILDQASSGIVGGYFNVLLAILILGAGLLGARYAHQAIADKNAALARVTRIAIIVLSVVVALDRSGIAPHLTGKPYEFGIYALALALGLGGAIAIGLGGKEYVHRWLEKRG
ncbi:MAG: mechanosensitive ion channel [Akkermansiaceae bacterium]|nr:mechanosensitive ion channel [Akkermansiaceae bacterium]NNM27882.1 mechanosensitive ion channel [Akkermansiaceae bacterium]